MRLVWECLLVALAAGLNRAGAQEPKDAEEKPAAKVEAKAQDAPAAAKTAAAGAKRPATAIETKQPPITAEQFPELVKRWDALDAQLDRLKEQYDAAPTSEEKGVFRKRFEKVVQESEQLLPKLRTATEAAFAANPGQDKDVTAYMLKFAAYETRQGRFDKALAISHSLLDAQVEDPALYALAGGAALEMGDFENAEKWMGMAKEAGQLDAAAGRRLESRLADWKKEQEVRQKEAEADDLPRVKLETSKGTIVVELFENEAPQTVGNFINLVEKKSYDDTTFHRVLAGFRAQGGDPKGTGAGGPGYTIYDECGRPDHRKHFRGSLSMANSGVPNSGGSQFFITFRPTSHLDGKHTVFGRVIEGQEVAESLQLRDPDDDVKPLPTPDKLLKAEVIRKRAHEYVPTKVKVDDSKGTKGVKGAEGKLGK